MGILGSVFYWNHNKENDYIMIINEWYINIWSSPADMSAAFTVLFMLWVVFFSYLKPSK